MFCSWLSYLLTSSSFSLSAAVSKNWSIPLQNGNLLLRIAELNRRISLCLPDEMIFPWVVVIYSDSWIFVCWSVNPCLSSTISLRPLVGLRPPSRIPSFSNSASLCLLYLSLLCPRHNTRRRSLSMLVLSHSDPHYINRHMAQCGCPDILTPCSTTVLFLMDCPSDFYFSRWGCGWGWVHLGSLEPMLRTTIVSDGTWFIHHQNEIRF